jgi:hypothetical protein
VAFGGARRVDMLPAEFRRDEPMRAFLEGLWGLLDTGVGHIGEVLARREELLDPRLTAPDLVRAIEAWLGMIPDPRIPANVRRHLLHLRIRSLGARGTCEGLRQRVSALLAALSGIGLDDVAAMVRIVEGFETRTTLRLGYGDGTRHRLAPRSALSLSGGIRLGRDVLDSRTDPAVADFQRTAHRAEITLPIALAADDVRADILTRAVAAEVPAHVAVTITRYPGGVRLGGEARLGLDTLLLDPREIRLACDGAGRRGAARLGIDARLASAGVAPGAMRLGPRTSRGGTARLP